MTCWTANRKISRAQDNRLTRLERVRLEAHLRECLPCSRRVQESGIVPKLLGRLSEPVPPSELHSRLCVTASRERKTSLAGSMLERFFVAFKYRLDEMMRPLTLSACSGLFSFLLFSALAFTISTNGRIVPDDVPVLYEDHTDANLVPVQLRSSVIVTFSLNANGRITDYHFRNEAGAFEGDTSRLQGISIPVPEIPAVLAVAQPISSDISIRLTPIFFRQ